MCSKLELRGEFAADQIFKARRLGETFVVYNLRVSSREYHLFMTHSARIISLDTLIAHSWDIVGIRI